ncbi:MAG: TonB-dependent receptor [Thermoflexibacter sp.]|jgi:iron complex outermembrane receptor protein|nr:TonB-dependent receptor [Thermoflexibacter sp.]
MKLILKTTFYISILVFPFFLQAQDKPVINATVSGTVIDSRSNEKLVGATVAIKGTTNGATTDANGEFYLITGQKLPFTVIVSYLGYLKKELVINENKVEIKLDEDLNQLAEIIVTARRRQESVQETPIPMTVIRGFTVEDAGAFNVNRLKELVPTVQLYSSNPRNTTLNIRGLGSTFGLTNDGIDPGVGFYVDGVYYARPAATTLDFIDIEQVEVLRGPQGTLFGKNTTAGAFNITTRAPSFETGGSFEVSYGNYGFMQSKASITGALTKKIAGRFSFSGTQRDGVLYNVRTERPENSLNNLGFRGQLLFTPTDKINITLIGDYSRQRPTGYAQVVAGVVTTQRPAYRQFNNIIADLGYKLPSTNPFDRLIDTDSPWRSGNDLGGVSLNIDAKIGGGTLTSTSAWRFWDWDPLNDRDFTGLPVLSKSQATSVHKNWSQEVRYAGSFSPKLSGVLGVFFIGQNLVTNPVHIEESGAAQWRFSQSSTSALWRTPGLFEGFGIQTTSTLNSLGAAAFGQLDYALTDKFHVLAGLRFNYDKKDVDFSRQTYGGLQTTVPALVALKNAVYTNQAFNVNAEEQNFSGQLTLAYKPFKKFNAFATYSNSYKPVGVNLGGLPTASGEVLVDLARIKPEYVTHVEFGIKTEPSPQATFNLTVYNTEIKDFQTQVQTAEVGVNRGYLANAERVRVFGIEADGSLRINNSLSFNASLAYTDGKYISFTNAPVPLEETGAPTAFKDISGGSLPGISKWAGSISGEASTRGNLLGLKGKYFVAIDGFYRSSFSSSPSPSKFLNIDGYALANGRIGFRASNGISVFLWGRNLFNQNYFEQLLPAAGNAGHYGAVLGDPRTWGTTLRYVF